MADETKAAAVLEQACAAGAPLSVRGSMSLAALTRARGASVAVSDTAGDSKEDEHQQLVRAGGHTYSTTQIFVMPAGDWSKALSAAVREGRNLRRACWIRGPYPSPYAISNDYANMLLFASGIGITPAMGVLSQFAGSRTCVVVWMVRSEEMLTFFVPHLAACSAAIIYYTGKKALTPEKEALLRRKAPLQIIHSRPKLDTIMPELIRMYAPRAQ